MHILAVFILSIALYSSFNPAVDSPKDKVDLATGANQELRHTFSVKPASEFQGERLVKQNFDYSCGSAALSTLLNFYLNEQLTERQVIQGMLEYGNAESIKKKRAFSLLDMKRFVNALGYEANGYKANIEDIQSPEYWPCLVRVKIFDYLHFVIIKGIHKGHVFVADPWKGHSSYKLSTFNQIWDPNVIFVVNARDGHKNNELKLVESDLQFIDESTAAFLIFQQQNEPGRETLMREPFERTGERIYFKQ
jgi:hypothetical protein